MNTVHQIVYFFLYRLCQLNYNIEMDTHDKTLILMGLILAVLVCLVIILRSKMQRVPINQTAMFENTKRVVANAKLPQDTTQVPQGMPVGPPRNKLGVTRVQNSF